MMSSRRRVHDADYRRLLEFRDGIRRFLRWTEELAMSAGLTAAQHQLLLAVRGHGAEELPTIGDVADHLLLRHHSCVELVNRAASAGLVERVPDEHDHRVVRIRLTDQATGVLAALSGRTLDELARLESGLRPIWAGLDVSG